MNYIILQKCVSSGFETKLLSVFWTATATRVQVFHPFNNYVSCVPSGILRHRQREGGTLVSIDTRQTDRQSDTPSYTHAIIAQSISGISALCGKSNSIPSAGGLDTSCARKNYTEQVGKVGTTRNSIYATDLRPYWDCLVTSLTKIQFRAQTHLKPQCNSNL